MKIEVGGKYTAWWEERSGDSHPWKRDTEFVWHFVIIHRVWQDGRYIYLGIKENQVFEDNYSPAWWFEENGITLPFDFHRFNIKYQRKY